MRMDSLTFMASLFADRFNQGIAPRGVRVLLQFFILIKRSYKQKMLTVSVNEFSNQFEFMIR